MKKKTALVVFVLLLCAALRVALAEPESTETAFAPTWHGDVAYADMAYEHYEESRFTELTLPMYTAAEQGMDSDAFADAEYALWDEYTYVASLYSLIELQSAADSTDDYARQELEYTADLYAGVSLAYWAAMHAVAASDHADLLTEIYGDWQIECFAGYDPEERPDTELYSQETRLEQTYYRLIAEADPDWTAIGEVFTELVAVRNAQARDSGYADYAALAYENTYARDYSPEDARAMWENVKTWFVPVLRTYEEAVLAKEAELLADETLDCSPEAVLSVLESVLAELSPELTEAYTYMTEYGLYDIGYSETKRRSGYTTVFYYYNEPFLFNCPADAFYDYTDTFHEFGHFASYYYGRNDLVFGWGDNDLAELQAQGLELLSSLYFDRFFSPETADTIQDDLLLSALYSVVDGAMYDEFQQRVYAEADLTPEQVEELFTQVWADYGYAPYEGYEHEWMRVEHNFTYPFYYISYDVSAVSALELFAQGCQDRQAAVARYLAAEALDPEDWYFSEALEEVGLGDVFLAETCADVAEQVEKCLAE